MLEGAKVVLGKEIGRKKKYEKYVYVRCPQCGKERWLRLGLLRRAKYPGYCRSCANLRDKRFNWKGGRSKQATGYVQIRVYPDDFFYPMANRDGYVFEHRLVVAKALGRNLHLWEIVHHKGTKYPKGSKEDKADNRYPENLQLVTDDRHKQITLLESKIERLQERIAILEGERRSKQGEG